jgi:alpha-galactosidase
LFGSEDYRHWFKTPIMGWNDFNDMGSASENLITNAALTFIANGLRDAGYRWIQLDAGWQSGQTKGGACVQQVRDANGFLSTKCVNFPHGMKWLASWLHARGFYLGLYLGGGDDPLRVFWTNAVKDAQTLADWDIDYIKFDGLPYAAGYLTTFANTIDTLYQSRGRQPIFIRAGFEIGTEWHWSPAELKLANAYNCSGDAYVHADGWRTNLLYDGVCTRTVLHPGAIIDEGFWAASKPTWASFRDTAATNILTAIRTMMGLNALLNCNLTIAKWDENQKGYLSIGIPAVLAIVTNRRVIAIDQDPAQVIGWPVLTNGTSVTWIKPLGSQDGPNWAVGLQNLRTNSHGAAVATFSLTNLTKPQGSLYYAQDVWSNTRFIFSNSFAVTNIEQQMSLYVISPYVSTDNLPPSLAITSHSNLQIVAASQITLSGTASDGVRGGSGIRSVAVNDVAATGGTAISNNVANWSRVVNLAPGMNTLSVVASDNAGWPNRVTNVIQIISDPLRPTLGITAPTPNQRWSNAVFSVKGTAGDNLRVVEVRCRTNGVWGLAQTGNGWTNWTVDVALAPGTNVVSAYAVDVAGNKSATNTASFVYVANEQLAVQATGPCTLSPNYSNAVLEVGKNYTMTANIGGGYVLSNWVGSVLGNVVLVSNAATVAFMMQSNLVLRANIIPNPFIAVNGSYNGLFAQTDRVQGSSGFVTLTLTTNGSYSGSLKQGTSSYAMSGQFDVAGQTSKVVTRSGTNAWAVALQLDFAGQRLLGWVSNGVSGGWVANLLADRAGFDNRTNPATQYLGKFTMRILGDTETGAPVFAGDGYLTLSVATNGQIAYGGSLADGNAVASGAAVVCRDGHVPLYAPLYSGKGSLWGWLAFDTSQPAKGFEGWLSWIKPAGMGTLYPLGLTNEVIAEGSRYVTPTKSLDRVIEITNGMVIFEGGNLSLPLTNLVILTESNKVTDLSLANGLNLSLTLSNGAFGGSVRQPGMTRSNVFKGVLLQDENGGYGYFLETNRSGRVVFRPVP